MLDGELRVEIFDLPSFAPATFCERRHRRLSRRLVVVCRRAMLVMFEGERPHQDCPTGTAAAFMMRPTTTPSASTSKSSSFHSSEIRLADARLRMSAGIFTRDCLASCQYPSARLGDPHPHDLNGSPDGDQALGGCNRYLSDAQIDHQLDGKPVREHDRLGAAIRRRGEQFERAAASGGKVALARRAGRQSQDPSQMPFAIDQDVI
jgi:hypothetical protein